MTELAPMSWKQGYAECECANAIKYLLIGQRTSVKYIETMDAIIGDSRPN
jgi:hypothetical protein